MMIINIIFFIPTICCAVSIATAGTSVSVTSIRSKRAIINSEHDISNNQEQFRGTTARISLPQNIITKSLSNYRSAKASEPHRISYINPNQKSSHAYGSVPKRPLPSYVSLPIYQINNKSYRNNLLVPYYDILNNSNSYETATSTEKPLNAFKPTVSQSLQKLQGIYSPNAFHQDKSIEFSGFSDFEYPSYVSISKLISQDVQNDVSSPIVQVPVYKTNYPLSKVEHAHGYTLNYPMASSVSPSSDKTMQSSKQKDEATVDVNGKKISVPIIQFQSNADFSEVLPVFKSQPFLSANYPIELDLTFNFGTGPKLNMALQSRNVSPFLSPLSSFQGQIVPIQTANGSPQFPQYKGASVKVYPSSNNVPKVQGSYESLYSQPQLHFGQEYNNYVQPINVQQNIVHPSVSTEGILNDVEIINKKNPEPHTPQSDDDDRDDERYKNPDKEDDSSEDDNAERQPGKYFEEPSTENDFKPSTSYPFKEYDERFGKYKAQIDDDDSDDKSHSSYKHDSVDDDEEEEDPSSEYHAKYTDSPKSSSYESYEEEDEDKEESIKHKRREEADANSDEIEPKQFKYYGKDFEQEFEESYRKELPKHKYVHVKEVPEIDSYNNPILSKRQQKNNNRSRIDHKQFEESTSQESRISSKNRRIPDYKDTIAYGSDIFAKKAPKVIHEDFFEYKNPEIRKYSKSKTKAIKIGETYSPEKEDSYLRAAKYYKLKNPKIGKQTSF